MKVFLSLLALVLLHEATCTHLETCNCHEIQDLVNKTVEQQVQEIKTIVNTTVEEAIARLEYKLSHKINTAISRINTTNGIELSKLENNLKLIKHGKTPKAYSDTTGLSLTTTTKL